jgi:hypothetical protein
VFWRAEHLYFLLELRACGACAACSELMRISAVVFVVTLFQVKLRDLDATNADGSKGREWTVRFDDVVAEVQQVRVLRVGAVVGCDLML